MAHSHTGAPLSIEFEGGETVDFARLTMDDWARWTNRVAAKAHRAVLRAMLARPDVPTPAAYKTANEELTRTRPMPDVAQAITADARFCGRLLREQAEKAGGNASALADLPAADVFELAQLLTAEATLTLPLLAPLSRQRERDRQRAERAEVKATTRMRVTALLDSMTASLRTSSGNRSDAATAA